MTKNFRLRSNLLVALGLFKDGDLPELYLIRASEWHKTNDLLKDRDYEGGKSLPEYGLNITRSTLPLLQEYAFERTVQDL